MTYLSRSLVINFPGNQVVLTLFFLQCLTFPLLSCWLENVVCPVLLCFGCKYKTTRRASMTVSPADCRRIVDDHYVSLPLLSSVPPLKSPFWFTVTKLNTPDLQETRKKIPTCHQTALRKWHHMALFVEWLRGVSFQLAKIVQKMLLEFWPPPVQNLYLNVFVFFSYQK